MLTRFDFEGLEKHIEGCLDEIIHARKCGTENTEFLVGEIHAYLDCLEIILQSKGVDRQQILLVEEKYGIRETV